MRIQVRMRSGSSPPVSRYNSPMSCTPSRAGCSSSGRQLRSRVPAGQYGTISSCDHCIPYHTVLTSCNVSTTISRLTMYREARDLLTMVAQSVYRLLKESTVQALRMCLKRTVPELQLVWHDSGFIQRSEEGVVVYRVLDPAQRLALQDWDWQPPVGKRRSRRIVARGAEDPGHDTRQGCVRIHRHAQWAPLCLLPPQQRNPFLQHKICHSYSSLSSACPRLH